MKATVACIPCMMRQAFLAARHCGGDPTLHKQVLDEAMRRYLALEDPLGITPGELSQVAYEACRDVMGVHDPYLHEKRSCNEKVMELYPELKARLDQSADPLADALLLAMAGNIIDLGIDQPYDLTEDVIKQMDRGFDVQELEQFRHALSGAKSILYLADNAGEIGFDRLLIEVLGPDRVTLMVKAGPIVNDAMLADAQQVGLTDIVRVVDTGSNYFGFPWHIVSRQAREQFRTADLVISKGHANFETVSELGPEEHSGIWYLLKVKCEDVAIAVPAASLGDVVLISHATVKAGRAPATGD